MTPQASRLMDTVESMLLDAGQQQDTELRAALLSLGSLASLPAPAPNAKLAALMASRPDELTRRRKQRRHGHRSAIVGLAVVAGMGLGVTGVAASASGPAEKSGLSVQDLLEDWAPSWSLSGLPAAAPDAALLPQPSSAGQETAPESGLQEPPAQEVPGKPAAPDSSLAAAPGAVADDDGADAAGTSGIPEADRESRGTSEPEKLPDSAQAPDVAKAKEPVRQALEKTEKLLADVVPGSPVSKETGKGSAGKSGTGKKADPGASWLKKFSH